MANTRHLLLLALSCLVLAASGAAAGYVAPYVAPYHGPPAPLAHDGRVIDTPEVAHAKAVHLATHAAEAAKASPSATAYDDYEGKYEGNGGYVAGQSLYYGPPAPLAHDGRVVDTPEVAHAKAAHLAAHAEQISKIAHIAPYQNAHW
ncbi:pupal cuticle protein [Apis mellifera caucasica]|uniref:Pupal cuticle protein n=1 Tax=Apis mellifera TaxID=7460 RepID=A0A7M7MM05_APIME|nr:pupal cuticle protein [Apis mellifera]KAG6802678.1 pupal cuticle protein [Apis mellifera caucasica]|eukprot:XP_026298000.1 pupal cuticle protein [Apis mellifera]